MSTPESVRWDSLVAALFGGSATGVSYAYSVYRGALKAQFRLEQSDVDTIGIVSNVVSLVSFVMGHCADRIAPGRATAIGGVIYAAAYAGRWGLTQCCTDSGRVRRNQHCWRGLLITDYSSSVHTAGALERDSVVGLVKAGVGLTGAVLTQCYTGFIGKPNDEPATLNYILMLAGWIFVFAVLPAPLLKVSPVG